MNKLLLSFVLGLVLVAQVRAEVTESVFNKGATGTTSATVIVPNGNGEAVINDLAYQIDAGLATATIAIRPGKTKFAVTSATSASGSVLWFTNSGTQVGVASYVIYFNAANATYTLLRASAATTTSITVQETITPATTTSDLVYSTEGTINRHALPSQTFTSGNVNIWLPKNVPSALTLDGNTTSCRISISGRRRSD